MSKRLCMCFIFGLLLMLWVIPNVSEVKAGIVELNPGTPSGGHFQQTWIPAAQVITAPAVAAPRTLSFIEKLANSSDLIVAVIQLAVFLFGFIAALRKMESKNRWKFITDNIHELHFKVERVVKETKFTKADDEFVNQVGKGFKAFGYLGVQKHEVEAIKALGQGYHEGMKMDPLVMMGEVEPGISLGTSDPLDPSAISSDPSPSPA